MATEFTYTPEEFEKRVKAYHTLMETKQLQFPDLAGLKNALDIEDEEYDAMANDPAYYKIVRWATRRRESYLNRAAITAKNTTGIKMLLAQPENGGYVEKPIDKTPRTISVILRGMDDDSDDIDDDSGSERSGDDDSGSDSDSEGREGADRLAGAEDE